MVLRNVEQLEPGDQGHTSVPRKDKALKVAKNINTLFSTSQGLPFYRRHLQQPSANTRLIVHGAAVPENIQTFESDTCHPRWVAIILRVMRIGEGSRPLFSIKRGTSGGLDCYFHQHQRCMNMLSDCWD
jgi:hypothetical protein